jgi:mono/diheme cytochrome c family protein
MNVKTIAAALAALCAPLLAPLFVPTVAQAADPAAVARGKYLVTIASCHDCHTPGYFLGKPDMARYLGGSDVGFELPGLGVFLGPNLTPDKETGLGNWTDAQIVAAIQTGATPSGRMLAPIMPYHAFANFTPQDVQAIVAFLRTIPPVQHKVEGPFGPSQTPNVYIMRIIPPPNAPKQ